MHNSAKAFMLVIACGLARSAAQRRAERWIARNFVPHNRPLRQRTLNGLKHEFERESTGDYLHRDEMRAAFAANDIAVVGEKVYARKLKCSASAVKKSIPVISRREDARGVAR